MSRFDRPTYQRFFNALSSAHLVEQLRDRRRRVEGMDNLSFYWIVDVYVTMPSDERGSGEKERPATRKERIVVHEGQRIDSPIRKNSSYRSALKTG